jgi:hypothetical protein
MGRWITVPEETLTHGPACFLDPREFPTKYWVETLPLIQAVAEDAEGNARGPMSTVGICAMIGVNWWGSNDRQIGDLHEIQSQWRTGVDDGCALKYRASGYEPLKVR